MSGSVVNPFTSSLISDICYQPLVRYMRLALWWCVREKTLLFLLSFLCEVITKKPTLCLSPRVKRIAQVWFSQLHLRWPEDTPWSKLIPLFQKNLWTEKKFVHEVKHKPMTKNGFQFLIGLPLEEDDTWSDTWEPITNLTRSEHIWSVSFKSTMIGLRSQNCSFT